MIKPVSVLCKRSRSIGDIGDNGLLVKGDWYDVVYNKYDTENTFTIINNRKILHLFYMYDIEHDNNHSLPRTYAKWFYTISELRRLKIDKIVHG